MKAKKTASSKVGRADVFITLRIPQALKAQMERAAEAEMRTLSSWLRRVADRAASEALGVK